MQMSRFSYALLSLAAASFAGLEASAQSQPVAWAPGYAGACGECDLSGRNLTGWVLTGGNYTGAKLEFAFMRRIQAGNANFEGVLATGADMRGAILTSAKFPQATLTDARLQRVQASGGDFNSAVLQGANLQGAVLVGANLASADLTRTYLEDADFSGANITGAWLDGALMTRTVFNGANMTGVSMLAGRVDGASFKDVRFIDADLTALEGAGSADFSGACVSPSTRLPEGMTLPVCIITPAAGPLLAAH